MSAPSAEPPSAAASSAAGPAAPTPSIFSKFTTGVKSIFGLTPEQQATQEKLRQKFIRSTPNASTFNQAVPISTTGVMRKRTRRNRKNYRKSRKSRR
jgi:hypothetical protein